MKRNKKKSANQAKAKQFANRRKVDGISSIPTMNEMNIALDTFINSNAEPIHLFIFGETGTRSWTFNPKNFTNVNELQQVEAELSNRTTTPLPSTLGEVVNLVGSCLDNDMDDKITVGSTLNQYIGYCALRQLLTTKTYKEGIKLGMNTGVISYMRANDGSYIARFHGMSNTNGSSLALQQQAYGIETRLSFLINKDDYKKSPMVKIMLK